MNVFVYYKFFIYYLGNALEQAFNAIPLPNVSGINFHLIRFIFSFIFAKNNIGEFNEKLAVMRMDGDALTLGDNPLAASEEFNKRGITLAVVATAISTFAVRDYYRTLADYTGMS